ncbi:MAG: shikimate dehydrogenase [Pirellulaceae bacterium]
MPDSHLQHLVCCMGQPVAGNPTQYMMEMAFADAGLDWRYLTMEVPPDRLADAMSGLRAMNFRGGNFTIPHKTSVIQYLDELSDAARLMGAVNCVNRVGDKLVGENTDGKGFVESLRTLVDPVGKKVTLLGAGGAARAIAIELALSGVVAMEIINRSVERGEQLAAQVRDNTNTSCEFKQWDGNYEVSEDADIVINATSIGLGDAQAQVPVAAESLQSNMIVADVIFNPPETQFLKMAQERGCSTLDGLGMLVNQGVIGFRIWTGVEPNAAVMREALEEYLEI